MAGKGLYNETERAIWDGEAWVRQRPPPPPPHFALLRWLPHVENPTLRSELQTRWTAENWPLALTIAAIYLCVIPIVRSHMDRRGPIDTAVMTPLLRCWNLGLAVFSFTGPARCPPAQPHWGAPPHSFGRCCRSPCLRTPFDRRVLPPRSARIDLLGAAVVWPRPGAARTELHAGALPHHHPDGGWIKGFVVCGRQVGFWVGLFIASKLVELLDTLWLLLKKRPVIFLHWCVRHQLERARRMMHSRPTSTLSQVSPFDGAALLLAFICMPRVFWSMVSFARVRFLLAFLQSCDLMPSTIWHRFAAMNYFVHSLMYSYFFLMTFPALRPAVKKINWILTLLQISQMMVSENRQSWNHQLQQHHTSATNNRSSQVTPHHGLCP